VELARHSTIGVVAVPSSRASRASTATAIGIATGLPGLAARNPLRV